MYEPPHHRQTSEKLPDIRMRSNQKSNRSILGQTTTNAYGQVPYQSIDNTPHVKHRAKYNFSETTGAGQ